MEELDLKELFGMFWNKKGIIIFIVIVAMAIGYIYSVGFVVPMYSSYTTLVLAGTSTSDSEEAVITTSDITINSKLIATYSELVKSKNVLREVISNLDIDVTEEELRSNISVNSVSSTELIEIKVTNKNATYAALVANEIAEVFKVKVSEIYNMDNIHVVDHAELSETPSNINVMRDIVIFALIGAVISVVYVLIANMLDTTVKTEYDIEKILDMPVLAMIPEYDMKLDKGRGGKR